MSGGGGGGSRNWDRFYQKIQSNLEHFSSNTVKTVNTLIFSIQKVLPGAFFISFWLA